MLYPKQAEIVKHLVDTFNEPDQIAGQHLFISGEMGVGKTYMASAIIGELGAKNTLIACPATVAKKWEKVAHEYNPDLTISIFNKKEIPDSQITIVRQKDLFNYFKMLIATFGLDSMQLNDGNVSTTAAAQNTLMSLRKEIHNSVNRTTECYVKITGHYEYRNFLELFNKRFDLAIFDEIHLYQPTYQEFVPLAILSQLPEQKILGLTGTIFNQNLTKLGLMLTYTNHRLISKLLNTDNWDCFQFDDLNRYLESPYRFYQNIWRYIGAQIGLNQIEERKSEEKATANQETMPLAGLDLSSEQAAWQEIAKAQLKHLSIGESQQNKLITSYIDLPSQKQITITRTQRIKNSDNDNPASMRLISDIGMTLTPIKLENTEKFKQLKKVLTENPQKTLIYVQDKRLLKPLAQKLPNTDYLPEDVKREDIEQRLADSFKKFDRVVVTSKRVNVGIDVREAQNVIWYQVPMDVATIIQANRRVLRLGDKEESKVWYLFYNNTTQEKTIKEVSAAAVNNAAAYSTRLNDNLAKVTRVLFANIDTDK